MNRRPSGAFFVFGFEGDGPPAHFASIYSRFSLGGFILFGRNIEEPGQVKQLIGELKAIARDRPIVIGVDQEGGRVQRLRPPHFPDFPSAREVGVGGAEQLGQDIGQLLHELGFNTDYAPVLDVNTNPDNPIIGDRAFGTDPETVAQASHNFLRGLQDAGVLGCGKHFPGHGYTDLDSHLAVPTVTRSSEDLACTDLVPFVEAIAADIAMLMSAHVIYPAYDAVRVATYSYPIATTLLRDQLGYQGVLITDSMDMAGAQAEGDLIGACIEAFAAGCDQLLVCENFEMHEELVAYFGESIDKSPALQERANESLPRIDRLKRRLAACALDLREPGRG